MKKNNCVIQALDNVCLSFPDRGLVLIVGKNGSGKSTLLNMIGLIDTPDSGEILLGGGDISKLKGKDRDLIRGEKISYVFQSINLINSFTAKENLLLVNKDEKAVESALSSVDILGCANKFPTQMSQGQVQKVAILRAMMSTSQVLLADEPTSALDVSMKDAVVEQLKEAAKSKLVIVVTHDTQLDWQHDIKVTFDDGRASITYAESNSLGENDVKGEESTDLCAETNGTDAKSSKKNPRGIGTLLAIKFSFRSIRKSLISSIVFAVFTLVTYVSFVLLLGCPFNDLDSILSKVYDENNNSYVIADCNQDAPDGAVAFSRFTDVTFSDIDIADGTSLWYAAIGYRGRRYGNVADVCLLDDRQMLKGRKASGSDEVVITDYVADCILKYGISEDKFQDYDGIIADGYMTMQYDDIKARLKIVGIVKTDADKYKNLDARRPVNLSVQMRGWKDGVLLPQNELDGEFASFLYSYEYGYCLSYVDIELDSKIADMTESMGINCSLTVGQDEKQCTVIAKSSVLDLDDVYSVGVGEAVVALSALIDEYEFYVMISEGISQGREASQIIGEYVNSLQSAQIDVQDTKYTVGGYYDDFQGEPLSAVYLPDSIVKEHFVKCLEENYQGSYAIFADGKDVFELSQKYSVFFPQYEIAASAAGKYNTVFYSVMIASAVLLLLSAIFIISDATMYCKSYSKQLGVMRCIGISNSSAAVTVFMKYIFIMTISYILSLAVSLPLVYTLSDIVTAPFKLSGFITFSPWSVVLSIAYVGVIFAIAYVFGLSKIKKKSLAELLR